MDYEEYVTEQEGRTFFDKPIRYTTLEFHQGKMTYDEFIQYLQNMGLQANLRNGEKFIEKWFELFLSYHEIEQANENDIKQNARTIDNIFEFGSFNRIFGWDKFDD